MGGLSVGSALQRLTILDPIPISAPSLGPRLPIVLFFSAALRPPVTGRVTTIKKKNRSSTKWLKERPQVSSEDVHYILLFCGNEQQLFRSGLQVPPPTRNYVTCKDPRFVLPRGNVIIPN